jgi:hypothetical protein
MDSALSASAFKARRVFRWAIFGVVVGLSNLHAEPQFSAGGRTVTFAPKDNLAREVDPFPGSSWGRGGPWADQIPYTPRPKPADWVDPEPSRWPWTGECDPYACPYRSQDDISPAGRDTQTAVGPMPTYRGSPPP